MKPSRWNFDYSSSCFQDDINWRVKQVSTHGHDRVIEANFMMPLWKRFEKKGLKHRDNVKIEPGASFVFPEITGPGCIVNIWVTFTPFKMRNVGHYERSWPARKQLWIQIFFDGESEPSVNSPIGDFFGVGFGEYKEFQSRYLEETSGGYVCRFPMPFKYGARVVIKNTSDHHSCLAFYGAVTYRQFIEPLEKDPFYFHALYREEFPTSEGIPYKILDIKGTGFHAGMVLNQENTRRGDGFRFLEGNTKFFIDGEMSPSLEYTGTEDIFQGAWYYIFGEYSAAYSGLTVRSLANFGPVRTFIFSQLLKNKASQYRFHELDAIPFNESLLAFIHHGEFDEIPTNQSSVTYFYAKKPNEVNMKPLDHGDFVDEYNG
ncbi:MAG: glycoside hydrolase family 172 protein [Promethearchaeota archaeon]